MKYTLLGTTSALAFISLVALMPIASMATTTGGYLPDMTPEQIREAIKNTPPFDVEKAKNEYYAKLKAETPTPPGMTNPTAQQIREWETQLMLRAEQLAQQDKATVQQQLADAGIFCEPF